MAINTISCGGKNSRMDGKGLAVTVVNWSATPQPKKRTDPVRFDVTFA
jgi:hypothetical protein